MATSRMYKAAFLGGSAMAAALSPANALAQQTETAYSPQSDVLMPVAGATGNTPDIVVTAARRAQRLQDVPISVTAIQPAELEARHIDNPAQLPLLAPSLQVQSNNASPAAAFFSVRGIGTLSFVNFINSSVSVVIDDVAMARPVMGVVSFSDIGQIEVLNGPQGMLFGKNASAGLVSIFTNNPVLGDFSGRVSAEYGRMTTPGDGSEYLLQGTINIPVTQNSALRLNASYTAYDPLAVNVVNPRGSDLGYGQYLVKAKYLWEPTDRLRLTIAGDYVSAKGLGPGVTTDRIALPGGVFAGLNAATGIVAGERNAKISSDADTQSKFNVGGIQAKAEYELGSGDTITNVLAWRRFSSYSKIDNDQHQIDILNELSGPSQVTQLSNELRLTSASGGKLEYQLGLYYLRARVKQDVFAFGNFGLGAPPAPFSSYIANFVTGTEHENSYAAFGQATYRATDALRITAGGRLTHDRLDNRGASVALNGPIQLIPVGRVPRTTTSHTDFSWRVSAQYDLSRDLMAYVTVSRGYKGPGFNQFSSVPVPAETSYNYEAGIKSQFLDHRVTLNATIFKERFKNFQAQTYDPATFQFTVQSAGALESRGFELQLEARPVPRLSLGANLSYVDAKFASFKGDQCYPGQPVGFDPQQSNVCVDGRSNSTGNRLPNAPKLTAVFSAQYVHPLSDALDLTLSGAYYKRSSVFFSSNADANTRLGGYGLLDANIAVGPSSKAWSVGVFCRNCGDTRFPTNIQASALSTGDYGQQFSPNSFRTIGAVFSSKF